MCVDGACVEVTDDSNLPPDDGNSCTGEVCEMGVEGHPPLAAGVSCADGGTVCDGAGSCVECNAATDCPAVVDPCAVALCELSSCIEEAAAPGSPAPSCAPYACDGVGTLCPSSCFDDGDCVGGAQCDGGACVISEGTVGCTSVLALPSAQVLSMAAPVVSPNGEATFAMQLQTFMNSLPAITRVHEDCSFGWSNQLYFRVDLIDLEVLSTGEVLMQRGLNTLGGINHTAAIDSLDDATGGATQVAVISPTASAPWRYPTGMSIDGSDQVLAGFSSMGYPVSYYGGPTTSEPTIVNYDASLAFVSQHAARANSAGLAAGYVGAFLAPPTWPEPGCQPVEPMATNDLVLHHRAPDGACLWVHAYGGSLVTTGQSLSVASTKNGEFAVAALVTSPMSFGGGLLLPLALQDLVIARLGDDGSHIWSHRFAAPSMSSPSVSVDAMGGTAVIGTFAGSLNLGSASMVDADAIADGFVAYFSGSGELSWVRQLVNPGTFVGALQPDGDMLLLSASPTFNVGGPPLLSGQGVASATIGPP